jgi:hypothetical protein
MIHIIALVLLASSAQAEPTALNPTQTPREQQRMLPRLPGVVKTIRIKQHYQSYYRRFPSIYEQPTLPTPGW